MNTEQTPPRRSTSSRHTYILDNRVVHAVEDGQHEQELSETTHPSDVLAFIQKVAGWYESDVDHRDELPLFADISEDGCIYIRDSQGGEWLMWSVDEWTDSTTTQLGDPEAHLNTSVTRSMINAIVLAYEHPSEIKQRYSRVQIESCQT